LPLTVSRRTEATQLSREISSGRATEVNPVITTLLQNGIEGNGDPQPYAGRAATAVLSALWANDDAVKLAKGLRAALDKTASTKS
jgi:hypothetical protein